MADEPALVSLEGAVAAFLRSVVDDLLGRLSDAADVRRTLLDLGVPVGDVDDVADFVAARTSDLRTIGDHVEQLVDLLAAEEIDPVAVGVQLSAVFAVLHDLSEDVPDVAVPGMPDAGTVVDALLALAVERALQERSALAWTAGKALHLLGPEVPPLDVLERVLEHPLDFVWQRVQHLRRHLDVTVAGILSGPRVLSVVARGVTPADTVSPEVAAVLPHGDVLLQRVVLRLAADTFTAPFQVVVEVLGHDPGGGGLPDFVGVAVTSEPLVGDLRVSERVTLALEPLNRPFGVALTGWTSDDVVPVQAGTPALGLATRFGAGFRFGSPEGLNLALSEPVLDPRLSPDRWSLRAGFERFELTVPQDVAGPVLAALLPQGGVRLTGKLVVAVDEEGLRAEGGIGLRTTWPDTLRLPGLTVRGLTTEITAASGGVTLSATGTVTLDLGVLTVTVEGLGLTQRVELRSAGNGNLGLLELAAPEAARPTGIGVGVDAVVVRGGGFLRLKPDGVSGALELALTLGAVELAVRAVGVIETVDGRLSFVVVMSVEFSPPVELFLGLTLNAVGGVFGVNRALDPEALLALVRAGRMSDVMFPHDLAARAPEVIDAVEGVFPARAGQIVVGPMLQLGWGRPVSFVTASVGVVLTIPDPVLIAVIGSFRIALPAPDLPVIDLRADFSGVIDPVAGRVSLDASLANSRIATFDVTGDIALRAGSDGFVFAAGGFHPEFQPPADLTDVRRLAISIAPSPLLSIRAEAYLAVTPSTVQLGGRLAVVADLGPIGVRGHLSMDVLVRTEPELAFSALLRGQFRLSFEGEDILSADLEVRLEGPGRWHARARAEISFLFFTVSGSLELSWGERAEVARPAVLVAAEVRAALAADPVWSQVLPAAEGGLVTLRDGAAALHPLGRLRLTQTLAPLEVALARFGSATVLDTGPVHVEVDAGLATPAPDEEVFAPAQFFDLTDDERLSKPSFVPYRAGFVLQGSDYGPLVDPVVGEVVYETSTGEDGLGARVRQPVDEAVLGWAVVGAAGRAHRERPPAVGPLEGLVVNPTRYAVASSTTGLLADDAGFAAARAFDASTHRSADTVVVADYELAGLH